MNSSFTFSISFTGIHINDKLSVFFILNPVFTVPLSCSNPFGIYTISPFSSFTCVHTFPSISTGGVIGFGVGSTGGSTGGSRGYSDGREGGQYSSRMQRDSREGRSGQMRRGYMEAKEEGKDKAEKMKELENYMKSLAEDVTEMVEGASQEEKTMLKTKMQTLMSKIQ